MKLIVSDYYVTWCIITVYIFIYFLTGMVNYVVVQIKLLMVENCSC